MIRPTVWLAAGSLWACGGLPPMTQAPPARRIELTQQCAALFPSGPWRAVHRIEASMPLGHYGSFLGITALEADGRSFRSLLLSVEGLVLIELSSSTTRNPRNHRTQLTVHRAVPPLDREGFADGLADDVRLVLLRPQGSAAEVGTLPDGALACRWAEPRGGFVETAQQATGAWRIRRYGEDGEVLREARAFAPIRQGFRSRVELSADGIGGYGLSLDLLEVEPATH